MTAPEPPGYVTPKGVCDLRGSSDLRGVSVTFGVYDSPSGRVQGTNKKRTSDSVVRVVDVSNIRAE